MKTFVAVGGVNGLFWVGEGTVSSELRHICEHGTKKVKWHAANDSICISTDQERWKTFNLGNLTEGYYGRALNKAHLLKWKHGLELVKENLFETRIEVLK